MISLIRRCAAGLLVALGFSLPASAVTNGTDFTDLWYNPAESGWGVNLIQQNNIVFATLFVYGSDSRATWFVASNLQGGGSGFTGQLYQTTGPVFSGGAFNPQAVTVTPVGTMTLAFNSGSTGTLTYSVNGVQVTKQIQRQTFGTDNLTGGYLGGVTATASNCRSASDARPILIFDTLTVNQSGNSISLRVDFNNAAGTLSRCDYAGSYTPTGRLGTINGTFNCTFGGAAGNQGSFTISQIDSTQSGFSGLFNGSDQFCSTYTGYFGGVRDVPHS